MKTLIDVKVLFSTMKKRIIGLTIFEFVMCFIIGYVIRFGGPLGWAMKELASAMLVLMLGMSIYECQEAISKNFYMPFALKVKGMTLFAILLGTYESILVVGLRRFYTSFHTWSNGGLTECIQKFVYTEPFGESIVIDLIDNIFFMSMIATIGLMFERLRQKWGNKKLLNIMMVISAACFLIGYICILKNISFVSNAFIWLYWIEKYFALKLVFRIMVMLIMLMIICKKAGKAEKNNEEA